MAADSEDLRRAYHEGHIEGSADRDDPRSLIKIPGMALDSLIDQSELAKERRRGYTDGETGEYNPPEQDEGSSSWCFLSTACVEAAGLPDNCEELTILRRFRDDLQHTIEGSRLVEQYYREAPIIVAEMKQSQSFSRECAFLLGEVREAVAHIKRNQTVAALTIYSRMFNRLRSAYGSVRLNLQHNT